MVNSHYGWDPQASDVSHKFSFYKKSSYIDLTFIKSKLIYLLKKISLSARPNKRPLRLYFRYNDIGHETLKLILIKTKVVKVFS